MPNREVKHTSEATAIPNVSSLEAPFRRHLAQYHCLCFAQFVCEDQRAVWCQGDDEKNQKTHGSGSNEAALIEGSLRAAVIP
jgi:hypothetical protein